MTWQVLVTVFTFGGIGAVVRGAVIFILAMPSVFVFPLPTLLINLIAALLGGFILSMTLPPDISTALSVGLVGGMGTLSAFAGDVLNHWFDNRHRQKIILITAAYILLTTITGVLGAAVGSKLGETIQKAHVQSEDAALFLEQTRALQQQFMDESFVHEHYHAPVPGSAEAEAEAAAHGKADGAAAGAAGGAADAAHEGDAASAGAAQTDNADKPAADDGAMSSAGRTKGDGAQTDNDGHNHDAEQKPAADKVKEDR